MGDTNMLIKLPANAIEQLANDYGNHPMMLSGQNIIHNIFLDYFNNFATVARFAEYYGFSEEFASALIKEGRRLNGEFNG